MKQELWKSLCIIGASFFVCTSDAIAQKPWTFLVYMAAAADDVHSSPLLDIQEMMRVGSNENVNILVYLTLHEDNQQKVTKKLYIEKGSVTQIGNAMVRDSGDVATLEEALQWACFDYPSDHIAVVLWAHRSEPLNRSLISSRSVCYDCDTDNYLTDRGCLQAFLWGRDSLRYGKKFDVIAFDDRLLGSLEIAYTLASCADYMVASEEIPGDGYRYSSILSQVATQSFDPLSFAQLIVSAYKKEYMGTSDYTVSAIDLAALQPFVDNCNAVAQILASQLVGKNKDVVKSTIKKCINVKNCPSFDEGMYIDVCQFYKNLLKNVSGLHLPKSIVNQFKQLLGKGIQLFSSMIKANVTSSHYSNAGGLSIYFSRYVLEPSYYGLYWTEHNPNWLNFLEAFLG